MRRGLWLRYACFSVAVLFGLTVAVPVGQAVAVGLEDTAGVGGRSAAGSGVLLSYQDSTLASGASGAYNPVLYVDVNGSFGPGSGRCRRSCRPGR